MIMTYQLNDRGEEVAKIQERLKITIDGIFGYETLQAVKQFQREHDLLCDGIVGPKTWAKLFSEIDIKKGYIDRHISRCLNRRIKYLILHYTAGTTSKSGAAMRTRDVFLKRNASADFVVDDENIVQINPDIKNYFTWAVGDKKNPYTGGGQLRSLVENRNSISIEMCSNLTAGADASVPNHEGWYFTEKTLENAKKLVKYLQKEYNIPKSNVIRHFDASGKLCPGVYGWNTGPLFTTQGNKTTKRNNDDKWKAFLDAL